MLLRFTLNIHQHLIKRSGYSTFIMHIKSIAELFSECYKRLQFFIIRCIMYTIWERSMPLVIDLLSPASINTMMPSILAKTGHLDVFHANAGSYSAGEVWLDDPDRWDAMLYLNINAVFRTIQAVLPHMIERGIGDVIATSSIAGHTPVVWEPVYTASKHAVTAFINTVRRQVIKHGIRVGEVSPGPVATALLKDWLPERLEKAKRDGALMAAEEVAEAVAFMLSRPRSVTIRDIIILPAAFDI